MKLYAVDYLLIHGRYCLVNEDFDTALALSHYIEAKQLINLYLRDCMKHQRKAEISFNS